MSYEGGTVVGSRSAWGGEGRGEKTVCHGAFEIRIKWMVRRMIE